VSGLHRGLDLARAIARRWGGLWWAERGSRAALLEIQKRRLGVLLEHAWNRSPFYRRRWGPRCPRAEDLGALEPLTKAELNEQYDDVLADRSLSRAALVRLLGAPQRGPHVVLGTSGTTGEPVVIPYARAEWIEGLVTNLYNVTLPIVRYQITDVMRIDDDPCPCGVPFARITSISGRREEILHLRGRDGALADVHPMLIETPLEARPWVRRFQIREVDGRLFLRVERSDQAEGAEAELRTALGEVLNAQGVSPQALEVELVEELQDERGKTDKRRRIVRG
jgi:phenylacetate-coenzyme A ligase PaaK-like adenylate-forming protein